jgi:hypothetical protein
MNENLNEDSVLEENNPMLNLVNEENNNNLEINTNEAIEYPAYTENEKDDSKESNNPIFVKTPILKNSGKPGFNNNEIQDARIDEELEGGIARPSTIRFSERDGSQEEGYIMKYNKQKKEIDKWEVSGFSVMIEITKGSGYMSKEIINFFDDCETAKASIVGGMYLMPIDKTYKLVRIVKGAPIITYNDRQLFQYIDNKWRNI